MSGPVRVRPAHDEDLPAAGALTAEAYLADGLLDDDDAYQAELRDAARRAAEATVLVATVPTTDVPTTDVPTTEVATAADRPDGQSVVARPDVPEEVVVGSVTLARYGSSYAEVAEPGEWELRMLAVAPEARRRGVAAALVLGALREAVAGEATGVVLSTLDDMQAAHRLYERLGFAPAPHRDWHHEQTWLRVHTWTVPSRPGVLVEAATWPPVRTVEVDGWRVGLSGGVTRRANSVLALRSPRDLTAAVERVEEVYRADGLPPTFRLDRDSRPGSLAQVLAERGYTSGSVTDVLVRPLPLVGTGAGADGPDQVVVHVADEPSPEWVAATAGVKGGSDGTVRAVLTGAPAQYLTAAAGGRLVGTARVALTGGWAGLSSVAVVPDARRSGIARRLTVQALRVAAQRGARRAFLQLEVHNDAAWALYASLGFRPADRYRYLVREPAGVDLTSAGSRPRC